MAACIAWAGQIKAGSVVKAPLHIVDLYATLLRLAGASLPQTLPLDGRDAWAAMTQGKPSPHTEILLNATPNTGAIRVGDWKLVAKAGGEWELYDLAADPVELTNLAQKHPDKVKELADKWAAWAKRCLVVPYPEGKK